MKIYRTKLGELRKLVKEQKARVDPNPTIPPPTHDEDTEGESYPDMKFAMDVIEAMGDGVEEMIARAKSRMKANLLDFTREQGKDIGKIADMISEIYGDPENIDVLGKLFLELYDESEW